MSTQLNNNQTYRNRNGTCSCVYGDTSCNVDVNECVGFANPVCYTCDHLSIGDPDGNGEINVADIVQIVSVVLDNDLPALTMEYWDGDPCLFNAMDVNQDGVVNVVDIVNIVGIILGSSRASSGEESIQEEVDLLNKIKELLELGDPNYNLYSVEKLLTEYSRKNRYPKINVSTRSYRNRSICACACEDSTEPPDDCPEQIWPTIYITPGQFTVVAMNLQTDASNYEANRILNQSFFEDEALTIPCNWCDGSNISSQVFTSPGISNVPSSTYFSGMGGWTTQELVAGWAYWIYTPLTGTDCCTGGYFKPTNPSDGNI